MLLVGIYTSCLLYISSSSPLAETVALIYAVLVSLLGLTTLIYYSLLPHQVLACLLAPRTSLRYFLLLRTNPVRS
jgi:uncharacterized membrane protein